MNMYMECNKQSLLRHYHIQMYIQIIIKKIRNVF